MFGLRIGRMGAVGSGVAPATQVGAPYFSPVPGEFGPTQSVTIGSNTVGATIRYTTDLSDPTPSHGTVYVGAVSIAATTTLKAIAYDGVLLDSAVRTGVFTINGQVATPTFSPVAGNYATAQDVAISCATAGAAIESSTDNITFTPYTAPINVAVAGTLYARATKADYVDSAVGSAAYTIGASSLLMESSGYVLMETSDHILLEA